MKAFPANIACCSERIRRSPEVAPGHGYFRSCRSRLPGERRSVEPIICVVCWSDSLRNANRTSENTRERRAMHEKTMGLHRIAAVRPGKSFGISVGGVEGYCVISG